MSILIKGVEKPKGCCHCRFLSKTKISSDCKFLTIDYYCDVLAKWKGKTDCPLIELPPHGRLIDADALMKYEENVSYKDEWHMTVTDSFVSVENIVHAPTIIESEGGE